MTYGFAPGVSMKMKGVLYDDCSKYVFSKSNIGKLRYSIPYWQLIKERIAGIMNSLLNTLKMIRRYISEYCPGAL
jgi:hypothetical protein